MSLGVAGCSWVEWGGGGWRLSRVWWMGVELGGMDGSMLWRGVGVVAGVIVACVCACDAGLGLDLA